VLLEEAPNRASMNAAPPAGCGLTNTASTKASSRLQSATSTTANGLMFGKPPPVVVCVGVGGVGVHVGVNVGVGVSVAVLACSDTKRGTP